jgi:3'-5' exoribonuclease
MSKQMISELAAREAVDSIFAVTEKSLTGFKNKAGSYLNLRLTDSSGSLSGRVWDNAEALAEEFAINDVVHVTGRVDEYRGQLQLIVETLRLAQPDEYEKADLLASTKRDTLQLVTRLFDYIAQVHNPYLQQLLHAFFDDEQVVNAFSEAPGAKALHHSHVGGLLEHTVAVVTILSTVQELHPELNRDLLITAGLLHDYGKLEELAVATSIEYTDMGRLLGHIVLTDRAVRQRIEAIEGFPVELDNHLNHILLSHHGQKEYGAPIVPMTAEACALHYADNLDAHVQYFQQVIERGQASGNRWTEYQKLFDRYLYIAPPEESQPDPATEQ